MDWYYLEAGRELGPITEDRLAALRAQGAVGPDTPVRRTGQPDWAPLGALAMDDTPTAPIAPPPLPTNVCGLCGGTNLPQDLLEFDGRFICRSCKSLYFLRIRTGVPADHGTRPASFGRRAAAKAIDINLAASLMFLGLGAESLTQSDNPIFGLIAGLGPFLLHAASNIWTVGRFGASPGKLALGLRIEAAGGGEPGYALAAARLAAEVLSTTCLFGGYLMQPLDPQHRAMHDHICQTCVVEAGV